MASPAQLNAIVNRLLEREPKCASVKVLAIDGGAAAGKSTLATEVSTALRANGIGCAVLSTDDLLDGWGDQFGFWSRLQEQVLKPLARGTDASYPRYDWVAGRFEPALVRLPTPDVLIVEGVSAIDACADFSCVTVLLQASREQRLRRWIERDGIDPDTSTGHTQVPDEWIRWLAAEDAYFSDKNWQTADIVITT